VAYSSVGVTTGTSKYMKSNSVSSVEIQIVALSGCTEGVFDPIPGDSIKGLATFDADAVSTYHVVTAATTNAASVKASPGYLRGWSCFNASAGTIYVKLHNTAGTPTAGASVAYVIAVPPGFPVSRTLPGRGRQFSVGIGITVVTGITDASAVAVALSDAVIELEFE